MTEDKNKVETNSKKTGKVALAVLSAAMLIGGATAAVAMNAAQANVQNVNAEAVQEYHPEILREAAASSSSATSSVATSSEAAFEEITAKDVIDLGAFQIGTPGDSKGTLFTIKAPADYVVDATKKLHIAVKIDGGTTYELTDKEVIALSADGGTVSVKVAAAGEHFVEIDSYLLTTDATKKTITRQNYNPQEYLVTTDLNSVSAAAFPFVMKAENIETVYYTNKIFQKDSYYIAVRFGALPAHVSSFSIKVNGEIVKKDGVAQTFGTNFFNGEYKIADLKVDDKKTVQVVYNYTDPSVKDAKVQQVEGILRTVTIGGDAYKATSAQKWAVAGKWALAIAVPTIGISLILFVAIKIILAIRGKKRNSRGYRR